MAKLTLDDLKLKGKRVLVRVDFNVPLETGDGDVKVNAEGEETVCAQIAPAKVARQ